MKKIITVLLILSIATLLSACGGEMEIQAEGKKSDISLFADYDYSSNVIEKGTEYSFGMDAWDMYVATAISDKLIRVVNWNKDSSDKPSFEEEEEIGVFRIDDPEIGFIWIDDDHTAFYMNIRDPNKSALKKSRAVSFSILTTNSNRNKGANYDNNAVSYSYEYDHLYTYKAIALTPTTIKIEAWRLHSGILWDKTLYSHDVLVINTDKTATDFEWTDDEHTSFALSMMDPENGNNWNKEKLVYFIIENENNLPQQNDPADTTTIENMTTHPTEIVTTPASKPSDNPITDSATTPETEPKEEPVSYSTNGRDTVRNGNAGVYAYKSRGGAYDIYWIVDFDENYVYYFTHGTGDDSCDRLKIDSGTLNSVVIITYHDGDMIWSNGLHFKYKNQPDHLIVEDHNGFEFDYYTTNLQSALALMKTKSIKDY